MKVTYNEVFGLINVLASASAIASTASASLRTSLLLAGAALDYKADEFRNLTNKALQKLKEDERFKEFDSMASQQQKANAILTRLEAYENFDGEGKHPNRPTDKEIESARETQKLLPQYREIERALLEEYNAAAHRLAFETTEVSVPSLSRQELEELVSLIPTDSSIKVGDKNISGTSFLSIFTKAFYR